MKFSPSVEMIWRVAADEMAAGEFNEVQPEHFCMALLKFAELTVKAPEDAGEQAELAEVVAKDKRLLLEALEKCGIESTSARRKLRRQLGKGDSPYKGGQVHRSAASRVLFESAAKLAQESGNETVTPLHLLTALVQSPTPAIAQVVLGEAPPPPPAALLPLLDKHGQDLVKQAAEGKLRSKPGLGAQAKAVLRTLQQKDRRSVLLVSDSDVLVVDLATTLASAIVAKDAPEGLKARRLMDVSGWDRLNAPRALARPALSPSQGEAQALDQMRKLLAEAASHPEVILLVPAMDAEPKQARGGQWTSLLRDTVAKGAVQFICRVKPKAFTEHLRNDPVWKRQTQAVWLEEAALGSVPREL